jgi:SAM-dependent methyltransferase
VARASDVYTHGHGDEVLRSHRWRTAQNSASYLLPHLRPGDRLLDAGCGPGTLTVDLARMVSPGEVVGIDVADTVVAEAANHAANAGVSNVSFRVGDFRHAGLEPGRFDVVHAHQVLQHLSDPVGALATMAELTRPGGIVAVRDADYGGFIWEPADETLARWRDVYSSTARRNGGEPDAGRCLLRWARAAGLANLTYSSSTWTFTTPADCTWWSQLWAERCVSPWFAQQASDYGIADQTELAALADGWRRWGRLPEALFIVPHGELLVRPVNDGSEEPDEVGTEPED